MPENFNIEKQCTNNIDTYLSWTYVSSYDCTYNINNLDFRDFFFNNIILVIIWIYIFFKIVRFVLDLFFKN